MYFVQLVAAVVGVENLLAQVRALLYLQVLVHQLYLRLQCRLSRLYGGGRERCRLQLLREGGHEREVLRVGQTRLVWSLKFTVHSLFFYWLNDISFVSENVPETLPTPLAGLSG